MRRLGQAMGRDKREYLSLVYLECYQEQEGLWLLGCQFMRLSSAAGTNRNHVERINDIQQPLFVLDDDIVAAHEYELRVRDWKLLAVGRSNSQRLLPHQLLPNHLSIHTLYIPRTHPAVKPPQKKQAEQCPNGLGDEAAKRRLGI